MSTEIRVPDIGDFDAVEVIEVLVSAGDAIENEQPLITLESDKATMEVPATAAGKVAEVRVKEGDKVAEGDVIVILEDSGGDAEDEGTADAAEDADEKASDSGRASAAEQEATTPPASSQPETRNASRETADGVDARPSAPGKAAHASPAVRKFARELGVDLSRVEGTGPKNRIRKEDVQQFVKQAVSGAGATPAAASGLPAQPDVDFSQFGETETVALSRIRKLSAKALHASWLRIPHVTQFDQADITDLEAFRKNQKSRAESEGVKLTMLAFLLKAAGVTLAEFPDLNSALAADGEHIIRKHYYNVGVAVDTDNGLVVPVIRDVLNKGVFDLAHELSEVSDRARNGKLKGADLQGGCFSISSLGGIGGTAFTPIVNSPEVGILGVSRAAMQPVWNGSEFVPRLMLPLSLSYDHRVIDGAVAARITGFLAEVLGDIRKLLL